MEPQVLDPLKLHSPRTVELTLTSFSYLSCIRNHSEVITIPPFSWVPRSPYLRLPSWEPKEVICLLSTHWGRLLPGGWPRGLTLSCGHSWWVGPSLQCVWSGLGHLESQNTRPKENMENWQVAHLLVLLGASPLRPGRANSLAAQGWNLAGASRNATETSTQETKYHTRRVGELRFIMPVGPEELILQLWALNKGITEFL